MASRALKKFCSVHLIVDRAYEQRLGHRVKLGNSAGVGGIHFVLSDLLMIGLAPHMFIIFT
jgi:hypothetical protein